MSSTTPAVMTGLTYATFVSDGVPRKTDLRLPEGGQITSSPMTSTLISGHRDAATDLALAAYERALEPKRLVIVKGGHFDPYLGQFETASHAAIDWFKSHL
jgi:hypothetical protein